MNLIFFELASSEVKPDLLGYLCHAQSEDGKMISEQQIADECQTFLFAGEDTTAATLSWLMYYLALHPHIFQKIQVEVSEVVGNSEITMDHVNNLHYCEHVLKETLRIQPVVPWLQRVAGKDCELAGVKICKNTLLCIGIYTLHNDPSIWKNPDQFIPERWDDPSSKKPFIYSPFSAGQRNCIGMKFATQEIIVTLVMIAQKFDISMNKEKKILSRYEGVITPHQLELKFIPRAK